MPALAAALALLGTAASALPARRLLDLRTTAVPVGSGARDFTPYDGALYFLARDGVAHRLFRTDGTLQGTHAAAEAPEGSPRWLPSQILGVVNGRLVLRGRDDLEGDELWTYTPQEGLRQVVLVPGEKDTAPLDPFVVGTRLFANGYASPYSRLLVTDGTQAGTQYLPGAPRWFDGAALGDLFVFAGWEPSRGSELYVSDGTPAGTGLLRELRAGATGGASSTVALGGKVLFLGDDGTTGYELWETDGTFAGTRLLKELNPGAASGALGRLVVSGGRAFFVGADPVAGRELWKTDGTAAGTELVVDLNPAGDSNLNLGPVLAGGIFLVVTSGTTTQTLMFSDGTALGTQALHTFSGATLEPSQARVAAGRGYFNVRLSTGAYELWTSDGTPGGTAVLTDEGGRSPAPAQGFTALGSTVLFMGTHPVTGQELWRTDGLPGTTALLANLAPESASANPYLAGKVAGLPAAWFHEVDGGFRLLRTDGTEAGSQITGADPAQAIVGAGAELGDAYVFFCSANGIALCTARSDAGIDALPTSQVSGYLSGLPFAFGPRVFFAGAGADGVEPWFYDGQDAGQLANLATQGSSTPGNFTILGDRLLFTGRPSFEVPALYVSDGTSAGTSRVRAFPNASWIGELVVAGDAGLLVVNDDAFGAELWRTDGTDLGTALLLDANPGPAGSNPEHLRPLGGLACFSADDGATGFELWCSDGTSAGTRRVADVRQGPVGSGPYPELLLRGRLLFRADDGVTGYELWAADLGDGGLERLTDTWPGRSSGVTDVFGPVGDGGWVVLVAGDPDAGFELWRSDGTRAGTSRVEDLAPGPASSLPSQFTLAPGGLLFTATDVAQDRELWVVPLDADFFGGAAVVPTPGPEGSRALRVGCGCGASSGGAAALLALAVALRRRASSRCSAGRSGSTAGRRSPLPTRCWGRR